MSLPGEKSTMKTTDQSFAAATGFSGVPERDRTPGKVLEELCPCTGSATGKKGRDLARKLLVANSEKRETAEMVCLRE